MNTEHKELSQHIHRALGTELLCTVVLADQSITADYLVTITGDLAAPKAEELIRQIRTDFTDTMPDLRMQTLGYSQAATLIRQGDPVVLSVFLFGTQLHNTRGTFSQLHHLAQRVDAETIPQERYKQMFFQRQAAPFNRPDIITFSHFRSSP